MDTGCLWGPLNPNWVPWTQASGWPNQANYQRSRLLSFPMSGHQLVPPGSSDRLAPVDPKFKLVPMDPGFPCSSAGKEFSCNSGRPEFDPWVGKIPWKRERPCTPGKDTEVGWHSLHQGIFPTQGLNPGLLSLPTELPGESLTGKGRGESWTKTNWIS